MYWKLKYAEKEREEEEEIQKQQYQQQQRSAEITEISNNNNNDDNYNEKPYWLETNEFIVHPNGNSDNSNYLCRRR